MGENKTNKLSIFFLLNINMNYYFIKVVFLLILNIMNIYLFIKKNYL